MKRLFNHPTVRTHGSQLLKFGLTGGAGSILDLGTLTLLTRVLSVPAEVAFLLSAFVGATFVFFVNKYFTFNHRASAFLPQLLKHYTVYGPRDHRELPALERALPRAARPRREIHRDRGDRGVELRDVAPLRVQEKPTN
jgi:hypothetical protein